MTPAELVREVRWSLLRALHFRVNPFVVASAWVRVLDEGPDEVRFEVGADFYHPWGSEMRCGKLPFVVRREDVAGDVVVAIRSVGRSDLAADDYRTHPSIAEWNLEAAELRREANADPILVGSFALVHLGAA